MKFVLLLSILLLWNAVEASSSNAILDINGLELQPYVSYKIISAIWGAGGGGVTLGTRNGSCPLNVAQENLDVFRGLSWTFLPVNANDKFISLSAYVNVAFAASPVFAESTVWRLGDIDEVTGHRYVTTGGVAGNNGLSTLSSWFSIDKYNDNSHFYKLVFCPHVCESCKAPICGYIGIFNEGGKRWLGLSDNPFMVYFVRDEAEGKMAIE